jgi:hypothetical protein
MIQVSWHRSAFPFHQPVTSINVRSRRAGYRCLPLPSGSSNAISLRILPSGLEGVNASAITFCESLWTAHKKAPLTLRPMGQFRLVRE